MMAAATLVVTIHRLRPEVAEWRRLMSAIAAIAIALSVGGVIREDREESARRRRPRKQQHDRRHTGRAQSRNDEQQSAEDYRRSGESNRGSGCELEVAVVVAKGQRDEQNGSGQRGPPSERARASAQHEGRGQRERERDQ